jgi:hypothetical protein
LFWNIVWKFAWNTPFIASIIVWYYVMVCTFACCGRKMSCLWSMVFPLNVVMLYFRILLLLSQNMIIFRAFFR